MNPAVPVAGAWVQLQTTTGDPLQTTTTNTLGQFTFLRLQAGPYQLLWRADGHPIPHTPPHRRSLTDGEYDLMLL
ncbi:MAG: carboxypeptidase regulatory-like domain-containing protein [Chloroflexi bacterium]|nr:carboxypeptidase regulatory-like domain-containing protein [Chloroflexota bacterium]